MPISRGVVRCEVGDSLARDSESRPVRWEGPGDDVDQRRLAGAVLAEQRMDLAMVQFEIDVIER